MPKKNLVIQHDLSKLSPEEMALYLRAVSEFIGLDPDLNGLDTIWMDNENGPGRSLVIYARRGTAEILREIYAIEVDELTDKMINGSIVFTAKGHSTNLQTTGRRQEIATGSKYITGLAGKALDDAIMTASTRAIRRLTMQFTKLGILDQSEVEAVVGSGVNPATNAQPVGAPVVFPPPQVAPNNAPGKVEMIGPSLDPKTQAQVATVIAIRELQKEAAAVVGEPFLGQQNQIDAAYQQLKEKEAAKEAAIPAPAAPATPAESPVTNESEPAKEAAKPKRARKPKNSVSLEGPEPEVVSAPAPVSATVETPAITVPVVPAQAIPVVPTQAAPAAPVQANDDFPGKPTTEQMAEYRKKVSTYTSELPSSENLGSVQKMRAFITHMSGTAPQFMTVDQWQEMLSFFESFMARNSTKNLITYINDTLGVK
jgi:hypothetical protein